MPDPGVVETATGTLLDWVGSVGLTSRAGAPHGEPADVHLWLVALLGEQELRPGFGLDPVRFRMRYLLAPGRVDDTTVLDRLLAATTTGPFPPIFEPVPAELWVSLGVRARPAFWVDVPGRLDRPLPVAPRVTAPLTFDAVPMRPLTGALVGPGNAPLAGMRVETADGAAAAYTDGDGRFVLDGLPAGRDIRLRLSGRGLRFHHNVTADAASPVVIRCELKEE